MVTLEGLAVGLDLLGRGLRLGLEVVVLTGTFGLLVGLSCALTGRCDMMTLAASGGLGGLTWKWAKGKEKELVGDTMCGEKDGNEVTGAGVGGETVVD